MDRTHPRDIEAGPSYDTATSLIARFMQGPCGDTTGTPGLAPLPQAAGLVGGGDLELAGRPQRASSDGPVPCGAFVSRWRHSAAMGFCPTRPFSLRLLRSWPNFPAKCIGIALRNHSTTSSLLGAGLGPSKLRFSARFQLGFCFSYKSLPTPRKTKKPTKNLTFPEDFSLRQKKTKQTFLAVSPFEVQYVARPRSALVPGALGPLMISRQRQVH